MENNFVKTALPFAFLTGNPWILVQVGRTQDIRLFSLFELLLEAAKGPIWLAQFAFPFQTSL